MIRKYLIIVLLFSITSCSKSSKTSPAVTSTSSTTAVTGHKGFIPWWVNDTIKAIVGTTGVFFDTMYCAASGDTSMVYFKGNRYYIWFEDPTGSQPFNDSVRSFLSCYIGQSLYDTTNYLSTCSVTSSQYWDNSGMKWQTEGQTIWVNQINKVDPDLYDGLFEY